MQSQTLPGNNLGFKNIVVLTEYFIRFKTSDELELLGVIDVMSATFNYDLIGESNGIFKIW